ncbi:hypothetical protein LUZ63_001497 [Rhynchospora breviuscula]|uniref:Legume lectin domain-containing protein n=1 Tax=Rhynchospora breviuscula TaxID=2022672 RepID=A0A9Q0CXG6_9POAL|nr:hypothetical protein LUZ63_001497 [Rhynchospora breviuscula]
MMKAFYITLFLLANNLLFSVCQDEFVFNGFAGANLTLDGIASITPNGLLRLTNDSIREKGHAFYPSPFQFHDSIDGKILSFSSMFVFGIISGFPDLNGHGITFTISPTKDLSNALANQYLGLFNDTNNGNLTNHIFAVELDTIYSSEFGDMDDNHVGIDINSLKSYKSSTAGYYPDGQNYFKNISLTSRRAIQVWVDYDGKEKVIEDWEIEFGSHRFSYKELYKATNGFKEKELLGTGGFGMVYKDVISLVRVTARAIDSTSS